MSGYTQLEKWLQDKDILDRLIASNSVQILEELAQKINSEVDTAEKISQVLVTASARLTIPLYLLVSEELSVLQRVHNNKHYLAYVKRLINSFLSVILAKLGEHRTEFEKTIITSKLDIEKAGATAPL